MHRLLRPAALRLALAVALAALLAPAAQGEANAAPTAYKYWGYYHAAGSTWEYSSKGADSYVPADGSVEGWRYGLDTSGKRPPRVTPDFSALCGDTTPTAGAKEVAVVIDYGVQQEAEGNDTTPQPRGACAQVPADFTGQQVLEKVADVRQDGFVVAIDGYPSKPTSKAFPATGVPTSEPTVTLATAGPASAGPTAGAATTAAGGGGFPWAVVGIAAVAALLAGAALTVSRRRA